MVKVEEEVEGASSDVDGSESGEDDKPGHEWAAAGDSVKCYRAFA